MKNKLYYGEEAKTWEQGMPVGNGRIGAMLLGGTAKERIWLNEDTLWSGFPLDYTDDKVPYYLKKVRALILNKEYEMAEKIISEKMVGIWNESYLPMGEVVIEMPELQAEKSEYKRCLDIGKGISTMQVQANGQWYQRSVFCSHVDQILVIKIAASQKFQKNVIIKLNSQLKHMQASYGSESYLEGWCPEIVEPDYYPAEEAIIYKSFEKTRAIKFQMGMKIVTDGELIAKEDKLEVVGGQEILLFITSANSFISYDKPAVAEYRQKVKAHLKQAASYSYEELKERHQADYTALFKRVEIDLGHSENENFFMEERLERFERGEDDPELLATCFQLGRYLLISSSREGTQPANLQGIWNAYLRPPFSSNYTVNINTQMNYWPAEVGNLSECVNPLLTFIKEIAKTGETTASVNYQCRGWVVHHNVDLWRKTTAVGSRNKEINVLPWSYWLMAGGWFCRHIWEHYLFNLNQKFLKEEAFPVMRECAKFYLDFLVEKEGELVIIPSTSPENRFVDKGGIRAVGCACTMDTLILTELFRNCLKAMELSPEIVEPILKQQLEVALNKLPPLRIGKEGQLQEWNEDFVESEIEHRHLSHMYGIYPGENILAERDTVLAKACHKSMERRGEGSVPWSRAWKIGIYARLKDGEKAYAEARRFLQPTADTEISYNNGGVFGNLLCARPLQVDGNLGFTGCMAEMFVQSHGETVEFLPAIPKAWQNGYVRGLKIRGNKEVEMEWKNGRIVKSHITEK